MAIRPHIRILGLSVLALYATTGCMRDIYYVSAKDRRYNVASAFMPAKITRESWVDPEDHSSAIYTSSTVTARERYHSNLLGTLHLRSSDDPNEESLTFAIRRENRAYTAETPIAAPFSIGKKKITPHFAIARHKDHDGIAGITFRMPF